MQGETMLKLHRTSMDTQPGAARATPGTVAFVDKDSLIVGTGKGFISILEIQQEGKKRLGIQDFLRGYSLKIGEAVG